MDQRGLGAKRAAKGKAVRAKGCFREAANIDKIRGRALGFWTPQNQAYAVSYLMNGGLPLYAAAGLVSRWVNVESTANGPTAVNPYSGAFGIAQWLGSRKTAIRGNTNFDAQLAYVLQELAGTERRAGAVLQGASNADTAAVGASMYERAEGYNSSTGRDNFTNRTAAGVPGVIANSGAGQGQGQAAQTTYPQVTVAQNTNPQPGEPSMLGPILLLGIGGLALYLFLD